MLLKYCRHVLRPNSSKKTLLLLRQTFIEIPKFMSSNNSTNSQTTSYNVPQEMPPTKEEIAEIAKKIPIDKRSLVLGLVVDEFEKDFIIYPEYENAREIERIREFVKEFETKLGKALSESPPDWTMSSKVREVLIKSSILAATMPKEYGGVDVGQKDLLQIAECMGGLDLSTFTSFSQIFMTSNLLVQFGNQEQCKRYLPGIAAGKWRPAICWQEDTTGVTPTTQVFQARGQGKRLCAVKVNVLDATDANLFIVFANKKSGDVVTPTCYIIEKDAIANDAIASIQVKDQIKSSGLENCNFSTVVFDNIPLVETYQLGDHVSSDTLMEELNFAGKTLYGAATVGFLKKVLAELCTFANTEVKGNLRLSDSHPVQKELYELGILTYIVESISYYIAGLSDEGLFLVQDIENSIIQRFANRALRQAIRTITEVAGINSTDVELPYNKMIKDSIALMSISDPDLHLVRRITIPAIEHHVNYFGGLQNFMRTSTLQKLYHWNHLETYLYPKLVHFIAEHVHRSLLESAQQFEYSMIRLNKIIEILVMQRGIYINTDYVALQDISTLIENNLAMIASLARASRSYSIGVRNSDLEVQWTNFFCQRAGQHSKRIITEILAQKENLIGTNPKLTNGALTLLDANGYCLESPIEKNW